MGNTDWHRPVLRRAATLFSDTRRIIEYSKSVLVQPNPPVTYQPSTLGRFRTQQSKPPIGDFVLYGAVPWELPEENNLNKNRHLVPRKQTWWSPIVHFGVHITVGSAIFVLIAFPAFGLGLLVKFLSNNGTAEYVVNVLTFLEYAIVTIDAMAFFAYLVITGFNAVKEMTE